ncbi:copper-binding protein [Crenobacter cavernae]|uniref:Cation transporter n=1 Tax=Crenobacter cavernae TaxID=2290923 RepID=A0ABY0FFX0_9NEIS|nr:copper-binding protein [Crenobacter cavernae]RXZ45294.1 cation transporter [Crenobacter cavernae]
MNRVIQALFVAAGLALALPGMATDMNSKMAMTKPAGKPAHGVGMIKKIDAKEGMVVLAHDPIKELNWPAMTMAFKVADAKLLKGAVVGKKVAFDLRADGMSAVVTSIRPAN